MTAKELYDVDFVEWTARNAELLRAGRLDEVDLEHVAEEIEDLGKYQRRELASRLRTLIAHLLKLRLDPGSRAAQGWKATVHVQRDEIRRLLKQAPSLHRCVEGEIAEVYPGAVSKAAAGTRRPNSAFPDHCPFTAEQVLDPAWCPE
jgi:hypothetical protein